ncbi:MAG TPA: APC family permease [Candidatus Polarisedimenticolia bacterium]|jgi:amino acid transporter|nr:APC family permease [Candidatus Polarisedimenticolia bacterium]
MGKYVPIKVVDRYRKSRASESPFSLKRILLGDPLATSQTTHQRISKTVALAVFSSDALSSVAYATEEILLALSAGGLAALSYGLPVAACVAILLFIVAVSYRQTIHAYPSGGGAYIVAKENLGEGPGLTAAAALLVDYLLTVAVSIASGVAAITSAFAALYGHRVALGVVLVALITLANLRGIRESGALFAPPTYFFIISLGALLLAGLIRSEFLGLPPVPHPPIEATEELGILLLLRAFASGCAALTGVEAISNAVPAFREPESRNASITLGWMAAILGFLFLGSTFLAHRLTLVPRAEETILSQLAHAVFGSGALYYMVQIATAMILVLAANTSFADFPRLASLLAKDRFLPRQLANRGDRLVFSNGILALGALSAVLLVIFHAETHAIIPLYAVGVFLSFTLSQFGMVRHWYDNPEPGWQRKMLVNLVGGITTAVVTVVIASTKFIHGAWIVVVLIWLLVMMFRGVRRHYTLVARELTLEGYVPTAPAGHLVVVLIAGVHRGVLEALRYARSLSSNVTALSVEIDPAVTERVRERWKQWAGGIPMVVLKSNYRSVVRPFLDYLDDYLEKNPNHLVTVILPEFVPTRWWHHLMHNQTAFLIKAALLFKSGVIVTSVPHHLARR